MVCKCGHNLVDHPYSQAASASYGQNLARFPCKLCDCKNYALTLMEYRLIVKKNKDGNFEIWKVDDQGIYYSILKADKELLKKMVETLKEAGF